LPLEFLKRRSSEAAAPPAARSRPSGPPEEIVAQDHQLKLYYAGKSSEGVRMKSGPKALAELPVVLVTALGSREHREHGIDVGANAYIVKSSFDQSNLLEVVRRLI
jgi:CheY-like chemotaxis protein